MTSKRPRQGGPPAELCGHVLDFARLDEDFEALMAGLDEGVLESPPPPLSAVGRTA